MGAVLTIVGSWLKYGGAQAPSKPFWLVILGQIISGAGQPFFLNVPTHYSDKWFSAQSRVSATALMSLANAIGAAVGQLVNPFLAPNSSDIPSMVPSAGMTVLTCFLVVVFCDYCIRD
jgi:FLVCR family MFS transporter 7